MKPLTNSEIDSLLDNTNRALNNAKKLLGLRIYFNDILMSNTYFNVIIKGEGTCSIDVSILRRAIRVSDLLLKTPTLVEPKDEIEI